MKDNNKNNKIFYIIGVIPVVWIALLLAPFASGGLIKIIEEFPKAMENPFRLMRAFFLWKSVTEITIPDGVTSIGDEAFRGCISLVSVTIPDGVTSIGRGAFYDCSSLTSITIPNSVTSIGESAFAGCASLPLTDITIPDSVTNSGLDFDWSACLTITVFRDSYAEQYCKDNDLKYVYVN